MQDFQIAHFSPGRLRVRLPEVRRDPQFAQQIEQLLGSIAGIRHIETSPVTGSVLVEYDPDELDIGSLLALGRMFNLIPENFPDAATEQTLSGAGSGGAGRAGGTLVGDALGSMVEHGSRMAGQLFNPRVAGPALALNSIARTVGMGVVVSPGVASAWILTSLLLGPKSRRPVNGSAGRGRPGSKK
jgi:hypothetical protein